MKADNAGAIDSRQSPVAGAPHVKMAAVAVAALRSGCLRSLPLLRTQIPSRTINTGLYEAPVIPYPIEEKVRHTEYERFDNPPEWSYVEALMHRRTVPAPQPKREYPSGWKPVDFEKASTQPYYVVRSRNHMLPVYLKIGQFGVRRFTRVQRVMGDLAQFEQDLKDYLLKKYRCKQIQVILTRRHEINCFIEIQGDYVLGAREFLLSKGF